MDRVAVVDLGDEGVVAAEDECAHRDLG